MCYDCGYLIDGWTQDGPNYQHPMTDGTPQAMPILRIDTNSYKGQLIAQLDNLWFCPLGLCIDCQGNLVQLDQSAVQTSGESVKLLKNYEYF